MTKARNKAEVCVGSGILLVLVLIAVSVFLKQYQYDPAVFSAVPPRASSGVGPRASAGPPSPFAAYLPSTLTPLSAPETFGPDNLYDKINGKEDLYLSAGFLSLRCQRFAEAGKGEPWMEFFLYDMGAPRNAFAVYSLQRRRDATKLDFSKFAYRTTNALYFARGRYYVEMVASEPNEKLMEAMLAFARNFVATTPGEDTVLSEVSLFPSEHLRQDSITLVISDAFGFDRLGNVLTAIYTVGEKEVTAFLSRRSTPEEAAELVGVYCGFLLKNGGHEVTPPAEIPGARLIAVMNTFELIFSYGSVFGGVRGAESKESAGKIAVALYNRIAESSDEQAPAK